MPTGFTLGAYTELFTDPLFWKAVGRTVIISIVPIVLCTVFVLLAMYVVVVYHPEWDKMIQILCTIPYAIQGVILQSAFCRFTAVRRNLSETECSCLLRLIWL